MTISVILVLLMVIPPSSEQIGMMTTEMVLSAVPACAGPASTEIARSTTATSVRDFLKKCCWKRSRHCVGMLILLRISSSRYIIRGDRLEKPPMRCSASSFFAPFRPQLRDVFFTGLGKTGPPYLLELCCYQPSVVVCPMVLETEQDDIIDCLSTTRSWRTSSDSSMESTSSS